MTGRIPRYALELVTHAQVPRPSAARCPPLSAAARNHGAAGSRAVWPLRRCRAARSDQRTASVVLPGQRSWSRPESSSRRLRWPRGCSLEPLPVAQPRRSCPGPVSPAGDPAKARGRDVQIAALSRATATRPGKSQNDRRAVSTWACRPAADRRAGGSALARGKVLRWERQSLRCCRGSR